ncbi:MAG: nuclear transport factor 2 family protein, partial [Flavisolibacter sp.]|nr:nuclear transport factor 2 family protein [Flavisolibacter sp.]
MKLTKQLETEILKAYNAYWEDYLNGNVESISALLADEYTQVGSAETEVFSNKKDAVQFLYDTIDQVAGKSQIRNRSIRLEPLDHLVLIHDLFDVYVLSDNEWMYYAQLRASTLMQEKSEGWKFIHQHSSFPDARTGEGENLAIDKIAEENQQLREAVKRRTIELEQKNHELEIEAALERVRAVAMEMRKADDLLHICRALFHEFLQLGFTDIRITIILIFNDEEGYLHDYNFSDDVGGSITKIFYNTHPVIDYSLNQIKSSNDAFAEVVVEGNQLKDWKEFRKKTGQINDPRLENISALYYYFYSTGFGAIGISSFKPLTSEQSSILKRFRNVFDLAYRRYIDITNAEAQAREAKIEAALERVRSRTMAMQKSDELAEVASLLFSQINGLGTKVWSSGFNIWQPEDVSCMAYMSSPNGSISAPFMTPLTEDRFFKNIYEAMQRGEDFYVMESGGKELEETYKYMFNLPDAKKGLEELVSSGFQMPTFQITHCVFFSHGYLMFITYEPCPEMWDIFKRFGKVFDQTYTRFLDLQKAEAQAREAKIEMALERVRARTMAMQRSDDLSLTVATIFEQLKSLDLEVLRCGIAIINKENKTQKFWTSARTGNDTVAHVSGDESMSIHPLLHEAFEAWLRQEDYSYVLQGNNLIEFYKAMESGNYKLPDAQSSELMGQTQYYFAASFKYGQLYAFRNSEFTEDTKKVMKRFADVINLAYTRFLDLQKAEAQAKEAQIEAALERVRARTMAMHDSNDVANVASVLFSELERLRIVTLRCGIFIVDEWNKIMEVWAAATRDGQAVRVTGRVSMTIHPLFEAALNAWKEKQSYLEYELSGEELSNYVDTVLSNAPQFAKTITRDKQWSYSFYFNEGALFTFVSEPFSPDTIAVLKKFAVVFGLTYRRYLDLKQAESNAREAQRQASIDRVRAEIASMRTTQDLERITPLIWNELTTLGVPFIRCGVFIMDDAQQVVHTFLSTPQGKAIAAFHIPYNTPGNITAIINHWQNKEIYTDHWDEKAFTEFADNLVQQGSLVSPEEYLSTMPLGGFFLHFLPFQQGMLYVGTMTELREEEIKLVQSLADAFSTAYARYEDFNKLEAAK